MTPEQRYLELLKTALVFTLWPEPPVPIETFDYHRSPIVRRLLSLLSRLLALRRLHLVKDRSYGFEEREERKIWPMYAQTMVGLKRLDGDMYESTMGALGNLYPKLFPGEFCIIDDYALAGCRAAVDDFRASEGISEQMRAVDWTGVYWRKG